MTALDAWFGTYDNPPRLDADTTGHARIVHRTTSGLRRPQPPGTATVTVQADIQPLIDQINRSAPAGVVDYPSEGALDHYARGGVIRVPLGRR